MIVLTRCLVSVISELTENVKVLIQSAFQSIVQEYKNQLEGVNSTVAMLQLYMINLKQENLNVQEKNLERLTESRNALSRKWAVWSMPLSEN